MALYQTHILWEGLQELVTYTLPVQAFVTGIKIFDQWKLRSIAWLFLSEALDHMIYIASFPGPVFRPSTEKQEKDARLYPFFCTTSDGKWAGPGNKAMIYSHLRGNWQPRIVSPVELLIFAGFTLVAWFLKGVDSLIPFYIWLQVSYYTPWFRNNFFPPPSERLFMTNALSLLD